MNRWPRTTLLTLLGGAGLSLAVLVGVPTAPGLGIVLAEVALAGLLLWLLLHPLLAPLYPAQPTTVAGALYRLYNRSWSLLLVAAAVGLGCGLLFLADLIHLLQQGSPPWQLWFTVGLACLAGAWSAADPRLERGLGLVILPAALWLWLLPWIVADPAALAPATARAAALTRGFADQELTSILGVIHRALSWIPLSVTAALCLVLLPHQSRAAGRLLRRAGGDRSVIAFRRVTAVLLGIGLAALAWACWVTTARQGAPSAVIAPSTMPTADWLCRAVPLGVLLAVGLAALGRLTLVGLLLPLSSLVWAVPGRSTVRLLGPALVLGNGLALCVLLGFDPRPGHGTLALAAVIGLANLGPALLLGRLRELAVERAVVAGLVCGVIGWFVVALVPADELVELLGADPSRRGHLLFLPLLINGVVAVVGSTVLRRDPERGHPVLSTLLPAPRVEALVGRYLDTAPGSVGAALLARLPRSAEAQGEPDTVKALDLLEIRLDLEAALCSALGAPTADRVLFAQRDTLQWDTLMGRELDRVPVEREISRQLAHRLRNQLPAIIRRMSRLKARLAPRSAGRQVLRGSQDMARYILEIVEDFEKYAVADRFSVRRPVQANRLVEGIVQYARTLAGERADIRFSPSPHPVRVPVNRAFLKEALLELVTNSLRHARGKRLTLIIELRPCLRALEISYRDDGPGVPEQLKERIFEPGFGSRDGGTGLGLAYIRRIVTRHGGSIVECGQPGQGAHFVVALPAEPEHGENAVVIADNVGDDRNPGADHG